MFMLTMMMMMMTMETMMMIKVSANQPNLACDCLAQVVQKPDNFIWWVRHYSGSKICFTLNVVQGFSTLPNLAVVRVCMFTCTRGNTCTEIFAQIETVG